MRFFLVVVEVWEEVLADFLAGAWVPAALVGGVEDFVAEDCCGAGLGVVWSCAGAVLTDGLVEAGASCGTAQAGELALLRSPHNIAGTSTNHHLRPNRPTLVLFARETRIANCQ